MRVVYLLNKSSSGATERTKPCDKQFDWLHPRSLAKLKNLKERKIHESLDVNKLEAKTKFDNTIKVLKLRKHKLLETFAQ